MFSSLLSPQFSLSRTVVVLLAVAVVAGMDLVARAHHERKAHYLFGVLLGTVLSVGLISLITQILHSPAQQNGYFMAAAILFLIVVWRMLFGNWDTRTKATVLGTFLFWVIFHLLYQENPVERIAHLIAIGFALVPALVWCTLFLPYHRERVSTVLALFFGGMLSTAPILFYDTLVHQHVELQFFLFRVSTENFQDMSQSFVGGQWPQLSSLRITVLSLIVSYVIVGLLEEGSKAWVVWRVGKNSMRSINDALQMAIIVAIGFAFAENINSSGYFVNFVKEYLLNGGKQDWISFLGNVAGRSVLTSMVHIVSTGVMGYFLGLGIFEAPLMGKRQAPTWGLRLIAYLHRLLGIDSAALYRREMVAAGIGFAVFLHALSNFLVSLPDVLPGNPRTLADLFHLGPDSYLHFIAILLIPTLVYVVGGFFLLTSLFLSQENMRERGRLEEAEMFVPGETDV